MMKGKSFVVLLFIWDDMDRYVERMEENLMSKRAVQKGTYKFMECEEEHVFK